MAPKQLLAIWATLLLILTGVATAQELEPRRWSHLPVGANFIGLGYAYGDIDILVDPVLQLEDVSAETHSVVFSYIRVLDVFGKSGRIDFTIPYTTGRWEGLLEGKPASTRRRGFNDPRVRFTVNLLGSPAQRGDGFSQKDINTIVGMAVDITAPLGEYQEEKLINLGENHWVIRPQLGIVHNWGRWAAELTSSIWFHTDNDELAGNLNREQDPLFSAQAHLIYTLRPGLWASLSAAYGGGAQSTIDGMTANDRVGKFLWSVAVGVPINRRQGFKLAYIRGDTSKSTGNDYNRVLFAYSMMWGS
jgi:hypothetical protein